MFVRVLKECECTLSFWYDRHWGDQWKDDAWEKRERQETLRAGQVIEAVKVHPLATHQDRCRIDMTFMAEMTNCYMGVPRDCIEILEGNPEQTATHKPLRTSR